MKLFRFILAKELKQSALIITAVTLFSLILIVFAMLNARSDEPYYSKAFEAVSKQDDILQTVEQKIQNSSQGISKAQQAVMDYIYGEDYDPYSPPKVIPNEMIEALYKDDSAQGEYAPDKAGDRRIWSEIKKHTSSQLTYKNKIEEQLESFRRSERRGMTDTYILNTSALLTDDYSKVLDTHTAEGLLDTRSADAFADYLASDKLLFIGLFAMLFYSFSADKQSRRYDMISLTKTGSFRFTEAKLASGMICILAFLLIYGFITVGTAILLSGGSVMSAPMQVLAGYELAPEAMTVSEFFVAAYLLRAMCAFTVGLAVMLMSFMCRRVLLSAVLGAAAAAVPMIAGSLYDKGGDLETAKIGIILSADISGLFAPVNYISAFGSPVKLYVIYIAAFITAAVTLGCALLIISAGGERHA